MKIALLGNMNNNHFAIARYLRDQGFDAHVLLFDDEYNHFLPSCDTYSLDYMSFCHQLSWGSQQRFLSTSKKQINSDLEQYNVLIGCGPAAAYCNKAGLRLDIFMPYGGDIMDITYYKIVSPKRILSFWYTAYMQKKGICNPKN